MKKEMANRMIKKGSNPTIGTRQLQTSPLNLKNFSWHQGLN